MFRLQCLDVIKKTHTHAHARARARARARTRTHTHTQPHTLTLTSSYPVFSVNLCRICLVGDALTLCDGNNAPKWQTTPFYMPMSVVSPTAGLVGQHILTVNFTKEQVCL